MTHRTLTGALCFALMGMASLMGHSSRVVHAQQLPPAQKFPEPAPLAGTKWILVESAGQRVAQNGRQPYFELKALEHYEGGSAGQLEDATDSCGNHLRGVYRTTGGWLHVRIISRTMLACRVTEHMPRGLVATLSGDQQFRIHGAELDLLDNSEQVRASFYCC
jgi:hypothetical protein